MNILIVDDEHILLKFMEKRIKELMPKAVIASFDNCQDAINYAENNLSFAGSFKDADDRNVIATNTITVTTNQNAQNGRSY